jgi:hypothetical protein
MDSTAELEHEKIRQICLDVPLVDAHAHNIVALDSNLPFLQCLSDERGHETLSGVPFSLAYQVRHSPSRSSRKIHLSRVQELKISHFTSRRLAHSQGDDLVLA